MHYRAQSAVEFISVYGFVLLIIAVILAVLLIFSNLPTTIYPPGCNSYGGFKCGDILYAPNSTTTNSSIFLFLSNTQPGIVNVSGFSATVDNRKSVTGSCAPQRSGQGETVKCIADIPITVKTGSIYTGYYAIYADYCAPPPYLEANTVCPANKNVTFTGQFIVQGS